MPGTSAATRRAPSTSSHCRRCAGSSASRRPRCSRRRRCGTRHGSTPDRQVGALGPFCCSHASTPASAQPDRARLGALPPVACAAACVGRGERAAGAERGVRRLGARVAPAIADPARGARGSRRPHAAAGPLARARQPLAKVRRERGHAGLVCGDLRGGRGRHRHPSPGKQRGRGRGGRRRRGRLEQSPRRHRGGGAAGRGRGRRAAAGGDGGARGRRDGAEGRVAPGRGGGARVDALQRRGLRVGGAARAGRAALHGALPAEGSNPGRAA